MLLYAGNKSKGMVNDMRDYTDQQYQKLGHLAEYLDNLAYWRGILAVQETPAGNYKEELEDLLQLKLKGGKL